MKVLVTGGVRSGKSRHAESLVGTGPVTYVAPGPVPEDDDADWAARVAAHRERRPAAWCTLETHDQSRTRMVPTLRVSSRACQDVADSADSAACCRVAVLPVLELEIR